MIPDICGRSGFGSSRSADLQQCLESRLKQRFGTGGSILFKETWRERVTPSGRVYWAHTASGHRTSGRDCTSVPTPNTMDTIDRPQGLRPSRIATNRTSGYLTEIVPLASCLTLMAGSPATEAYNAAGNNDYSRRIVELAALPTCRGTDGSKGGPNQRGSKGDMMMPSVAALATVTTPSSRDWKDSPGMSESGVDPDGSTRGRLDQLPRQAQLGGSGVTATGGTGEMRSIGQLDPAYSRWLMGYPKGWDDCADMVTLSFRKSRRSS